MERNKLLLLTLCFITVCVQAQLYSDDFNQSINNTTPPGGYSTSIINNETLELIGNGTAGVYSAVSYTAHNNGTAITVNTASSPKLYIKANATGFPELRIDLRDATGYVTNLNATAVNLTAEATIYELDYTGKLQDGGYGGPCTSAPCTVDATNIAGLEIFVNAAAGGYNGTIEIEWLSFGSPLEAIPPPANHDIRYNQVGYFTNRNKTISINAPTTFGGINYTITNASDEVVMSGTTGASQYWSDGGEYVATINITNLNTEGTYKIATSETEAFFKIDEAPYDALADATFKYFYYNRASTGISSTYGGAWSRNTGIPDTNIIVHSSAASPNRPTGFTFSAPKGWYDAGDYNKYIVNSGISTYTLLAAYEHYSSYYQNKSYNIPESGNNLPDILDEVIWNLDWMLDMQDTASGGGDGGVYHKLTGLSFSGEVMPDAYNLPRYVVQKTTSAALNFAAVTAVASRIFEDFTSEKPGYSAQLIQASEAAYAWAKANPNVYYNQPSDVQTGPYGDSNVADEFNWAAVELFITTGNNTYRDDINVNTIYDGVPAWPQTNGLSLISIAYHNSLLSSQINTTTANNRLIQTADAIKNQLTFGPMQIGMKTSDYVWGSNGSAGNQILMLIRAYELTNNNSYLSAAYAAMDYLLGRNGTGYCYVTGFGDKQVIDPHHRISKADTQPLPVPGMVAGGPHSGANSIGDCSSYPSTSPSATYTDEWCSYSTNEVTINWNAPLAYAVNALKHYQDLNTILSNDEFNFSTTSLVLYPNPAKDIINIKGLANETNITIECYDIQGKKLFASSLRDSNRSINISTLNSGVYFIKIKSSSKSIIKKIIKL